MTYQDSTGRPIEVKSRVRFRGRVYTIAEFLPGKGTGDTAAIVFEGPVHTTEIPDEISVDVAYDEPSGPLFDDDDEPGMAEHIANQLTESTWLAFPSFGGGRTSDYNPLVNAMKDKPPSFAAGVDIREVVLHIMSHLGRMSAGLENSDEE